MFKKYFENRFFVLCFTPLVIGALTTLSFQPFNLTIINFFIFPTLFYLIVYINKKSKTTYRKKPYKKNLFVFGLLFGFGFYFSSLSWIVNSLTFDENFKILIPFALILIPLFLSLFIAFVTLLIGPYLKLDFSSLLFFSASLSLSDYIRAKILTGFPWNLWAYSTSELSEILQIINVVGLYSYNLLVITFFILPVIIFCKIDKVKKILSLSLALLVIISFYIYGNYKKNKNLNFNQNIEEKIFVKIISPNFDLKYNLDLEDIKERFIKLIRYSEPNKSKKTVFIWPEGVFSGYSFDEISLFKDLITKNFSEKHLIIFGSNTYDFVSKNIFNSMLIVNNEFEIIHNYKKRNLVPFGEFLPFENLLSSFGFKKITEGHGSYTKGSNDNNLIIDNLSILPLICYEVIFSDLVQSSDKNTNLIINISEDGWFGNTIGPDQHFAKSIFRAIESNTFLLRSANKGISAIIDNKGNIIKHLNRNEAGSIDFEVPLIKSNKIKNDLIFFVLLITYLLIFLINKKKYVK